MTALVASDLDRTLIYSRGAFDLPEGHTVELVCVEHYDGKPLSFMTAAAARTVAQLAQVAVFVPVTTRTRAQLDRVQIPGPAPAFAIAANGGFLLVDGQPDPGWSRQVEQHLASTSAPLEQVWRHLGVQLDPAFTRSLRCAEDLFAYAVVDREALPSGFVAELAAWAGARGWSTSLQGRKLYVVPQGLTKSAAVAEVARRTGAGEVLAAGDSLLDADLLLAADRGVRPAHGELADAGWDAAHVGVTRHSGVLAGEEIAGWLLEAAGGNQPRSDPG